MIIIDKPYVSGFLKETIKKNSFPVIGTSDAGSLLGAEAFPLISENDAVLAFRASGGLPLYASSENSIQWIEKHLEFTGIPQKIRLFKDKAAFRDLLKPLYPDFFYRKVRLDELSQLKPDGWPFPLIIKPSTGFFSLGVHRVDDAGSWDAVIREISEEAIGISNLYPREVLNVDDFIIEECIEGEEYAVDCYYNREGKAVILGILLHLFSSEHDVSDRVYITSKEIIESRLPDINNFLTDMGNLAGLVNFPAHVEVRITGDGRIIPIEVNPMRFGGWCTTADLTWHAWGFNSYEYYHWGKEPDWNSITALKSGLTYSLVVLDNSTGIRGDRITGFDFARLSENFRNPLEIRPVDHAVWPLFGFVFCETQSNDMDELYRILRSDLREYLLF